MPRCCRRAFRWPTRPGPSRPKTSSASWSTPPSSPRRCASDRRPAHPPGDREARRAGQTPGRPAAPELSPRGQTRLHHGRPLYPCPPVQARSAATQFLRTRLGRIIRDVRRKIEGDAARQDRFGPLLDLALRVRHQEQRQRGPKVYSLHAPEVECIGRGKARTPYEFGCKVSIATPATAPKGGQFVLHAKALHGNPYDGHTLGPVITDLEKLTGVAVRRIHGDKGYRATTIPTGSGSGLAARSAASQKSFAARCDAELPSSP